jgi:hypothetical protein
MARPGCPFTSDTDTEVVAHLIARSVRRDPGGSRPGGARQDRGDLRARRHGRAAPRPHRRGAPRFTTHPGRGGEGDAGGQRRGGARAAYVPGGAPRRRRTRHRDGRGFHDLRPGRQRHRPRARRDRGRLPQRISSSPGTSTTCTRKSSGAAGEERQPSSAVGSMTRLRHGPPQRAEPQLRASCAPSAASSSSAAGPPTTSARSAPNLIEDLARIPADAEPASEFRYRNPIIEPDTAVCRGLPSPARRPTPPSRFRRSSARAVTVIGVGQRGRLHHRARRSTVASTCTPGRRSRSRRQRR